MAKITTYPKMNKQIVSLLRMSDEPIELYAAQLIEELMESQRYGKWIPVTNGRGGHECDKCHEYASSYQSGVEYLSHYCPSCGAKMENGW